MSYLQLQMSSLEVQIYLVTFVVLYFQTQTLMNARSVPVVVPSFVKINQAVTCASVTKVTKDEILTTCARKKTVRNNLI